MSAFTSFPTCPQHLALLQDNRLTILERNALLVLAAHVNPESLTATVSYEQLRPYLSQTTVGTQAAIETVNRAILVLRLTRWIHLAPRRRDPNTGQVQVNQYAVHAVPLSFADVLDADTGYLALLTDSLTHKHPAIRIAAETVLAEIAADSYLESRLSPDLCTRVGADNSPSTVEAKSDTVRTYKILNKEVHTYSTEPDPEKSASIPQLTLPQRFESLQPDQQNDILVKLGKVPPTQRQPVLDEWNCRCERGEARNPVAYLFGLIKKALAGQFRLWAGRKVVQEETTPEAVPVVSKVRQAAPAVPPIPPKPDYQPASLEVANAHLDDICLMLGMKRRCSGGGKGHPTPVLT
jgi:hypothetical protein